MLWHRRACKQVKESLKPLFPRLWRYCLLLTGSADRASDLAQSACLRALEKAEQFAADSDLDRWLFRIAKNMWFNELRAEAVRHGGGIHPVDDLDLLDHAAGPESSTVTTDVVQGVMALPEAQRIVVGLVYIEGYSYREAAEIVDVPVGTIMSRLAAARGKLSEKFKPYQSDVV